MQWGCTDTVVMLTPEQEQVLHWKEVEGLSFSQIADRLGIHLRNAEKRVARARTARKKAEENPGVAEALRATGVSPGAAKFGYRRVEQEDGSFNTVFWRMEEEAAETLSERLVGAFNDLKPAKPVTAPKTTLGDLCTVYPLMDFHLGMHAWGKETGAEDYDLKLAQDDLRLALSKLDMITPNSKEAVLILGGDTFHSDDGYVTPENRHQLDHDGRIFKVLDTGVAVVAEAIERLLKKHSRLTIRVLRGNHDKHSHMVLTFALEQRYRNEKRVTVEKTAFDLFMKQWGKCLIAAHHGDKAPPERLTLYLSDVCPYWSETRHRICLTGHVHHGQAKDVGPLRWESLQAFCPPDAYASGMGYTQRRAMQALTFHKEDGLVMRAIDPIQRAA